MDSSRYTHRINSFYAQFISDNNYHVLGILYEVKKGLCWDHVCPRSVHMYVCDPISGTQLCYIFITFHKEILYKKFSREHKFCENCIVTVTL